MSALKKPAPQEDPVTEEAELHALAQELHFEIRKLRDEMRGLIEKSEKDDLTGLLRRDAFLKRTQEVFKDDQSPMEGSALIILDVDHFKSINDNHGHPVGDEVLKRISEILKKFESPTTHIARFGGEEFILSTRCSEGEALSMANEIRRTIERNSGTHLPYFTVSVGVATLKPNQTQDFDHLYQRTDEALYFSKQNGRNRVTLAD